MSPSADNNNEAHRMYWHWPPPGAQHGHHHAPGHHGDIGNEWDHSSLIKCLFEWMCQKASRPWMFDLNGVKLETDLIFYHFSKAWGERCRHAVRYLTPLMAGRAGSPRHKLCVKYFIFRDVSVVSPELRWCCRVWADMWVCDTGDANISNSSRLKINREFRDPVIDGEYCSWGEVPDIWRVQENIWMLCNNRIKIFANRSLNDILADRSDWLIEQRILQGYR